MLVEFALDARLEFDFLYVPKGQRGDFFIDQIRLQTFNFKFVTSFLLDIELSNTYVKPIF